MVASLAACEAVYLHGLLTELGFPPPAPTELRIDNSGAINLAPVLVSHAESAKQTQRGEFKIRELVANGTITPKYVKSEHNTADTFTKPL
eukprot:3728521-Pleurochrysis_carterae.AAC.3